MFDWGYKKSALTMKGRHADTDQGKVYECNEDILKGESAGTATGGWKEEYCRATQYRAGRLLVDLSGTTSTGRKTK